jgi:hypothetical protein
MQHSWEYGFSHFSASRADNFFILYDGSCLYIWLKLMIHVSTDKCYGRSSRFLEYQITESKCSKSCTQILRSTSKMGRISKSSSAEFQTRRQPSTHPLYIFVSFTQYPTLSTKKMEVKTPEFPWQPDALQLETREGCRRLSKLRAMEKSRSPRRMLGHGVQHDDQYGDHSGPYAMPT